MTDEVRQYIDDIANLWEPYVMSPEEVAYFEAERAKPFIPLKPEQMKLLPTKAKI